MARSQSPDASSVIPSTEQVAKDLDGESGENDSGSQEPSTVTDDEYDAMQTILLNIYAYRTDDGDDPSKLFHRKVNRRVLPDYYDVIKEPMAMSMIKAKINSREYKSFEEFVRDFALICHNAQVYNAPNARAYQDALTIKSVLEGELAQLVKKRVVTAERAALPFLGEIPPADENMADDVEEEEDDDDEDDEEEDDDSDDEGKKRRRRGRPSLAKREGRAEGKDKEEDPEARKKRGRPPRVDTPMEARIKAVIKGLRKFKNSKGQLMVTTFERMPDKALMPEYFSEIKQPMALDLIKKKLKRKKYTTVDQFMVDVELMFDNAKQYNKDESQIYKDAVELQKEARVLVAQEKSKPDSDFGMEDGRIPLPEGILHNGELWKVGDWVHIQNANDLTKPIVAQIYRTWEDQDGGKWVNACWYYRPEQTVHRFDRHFFENEVVKTGQYRDHPIDEVVDRCFVMFFTRYNKGRPRGFPADKEVYVCEARYNEEKHKINKIKTWASCLPDEVRDKDYEMDMFDAPKRLKKVPSPIKYLFKEGEQKETDDLPKPVWGAPNAPPKIGAVHCRPRDPKETPPPEPTPTPPPQPPPPQPRQIATHQPNGLATDRPGGVNMAITNQVPLQPSPAAPSHHPSQTFTPSHPAQYQPSPASATQVHQPIRPSAYPSGHQPTFTPQHVPSPMGHYGTPTQAHPIHRGPAHLPPVAYKAPNPIEVWHLPDAANQSIPEDIRSQFQQDMHGRVLFFTAPPEPPAEESKPRLAHSTSYLAARARQLRDHLEAKKRGPEESAVFGAEERPVVKKSRVEQDARNGLSVEEVCQRAMDSINNTLADGLIADCQRLYPEGEWQQAIAEHLNKVAGGLLESARHLEECQAKMDEEVRRRREELSVRGLTGIMDYRPPNEALEWRR